MSALLLMTCSFIQLTVFHSFSFSQFLTTALLHHLSSTPTNTCIFPPSFSFFVYVITTLAVDFKSSPSPLSFPLLSFSLVKHVNAKKEIKEKNTSIPFLNSCFDVCDSPLSSTSDRCHCPRTQAPPLATAAHDAEGQQAYRGEAVEVQDESLPVFFEGRGVSIR